MRLVIAVIRPEDLDAVQDAVDEMDARMICVSEIRYAPERGRGFYRGAEYQSMPLRLRLEIVIVNESLVPGLIEALNCAVSKTGRGSSGGEALVLELEEAMRFTGC